MYRAQLQKNGLGGASDLGTQSDDRIELFESQVCKNEKEMSKSSSRWHITIISSPNNYSTIQYNTIEHLYRALTKTSLARERVMLHS